MYIHNTACRDLSQSQIHVQCTCSYRVSHNWGFVVPIKQWQKCQNTGTCKNGLTQHAIMSDKATIC